MEIWTPQHYPEPSPPAMRDSLLRREYLSRLKSERSYRGNLPLDCPSYERWLQDLKAARIGTPGAMNAGFRSMSGVDTQLLGANFSLANLIAYYKFEGAAGSKGTDSSGNGENMTDHGTVADVAGVIGRGASLGSSSRWLTHADDANLSMGTNQVFTLHGWVNIQGAFPGTAPCLLGKVDNAGTLAGIEYELAWSGGFLQFLVCDGSGISNWADSFVAVNGAGWHFFYIQVKAGPTCVAAVDMNPETSPGASHWAQDSTNSWSIGGASDGSRNVAEFVDSVGIWKRVLSNSELSQLYNSGAGFDPV